MAGRAAHPDDTGRWTAESSGAAAATAATEPNCAGGSSPQAVPMRRSSTGQATEFSLARWCPTRRGCQSHGRRRLAHDEPPTLRCLMFPIIACPECCAATQLNPVGSHESEDGDLDGLQYRFLHGRCVRCGSPAVLMCSRHDGEGPEWSDYRQLFPRPARTVDSTLALPTQVRTSFLEAVRCESAEAWLATSVMVRRTLEAIGKEFDPAVKSPQKALEALKTKGVISQEMWEWGDHLRFLGNIGAHPSADEVGKQDASDALDFLQAIIETIFRLRMQFGALKRRREGTTDPAENGD